MLIGEAVMRGVCVVGHGIVECSRCWTEASCNVQDKGRYRLVRDPGHWGSANPKVLVLGISKGNTQSNAFRNDHFDNVAFKGIRHRILECFQSVGLLEAEKPAHFERRFHSDEKDFAFASVVRCSLTGMDKKKGHHTAESPNVIPAFNANDEGAFFVQNCVDQHLVELPDRTRLVVLLGNTPTYMKRLAAVIDQRRGKVSRFNEVAYVSDGVWFVHLTHPSKGNGNFGAFVRGEGTSGRKRDLARAALKEWNASCAGG